MRFIYTLLFYALIPLILARLAWRGRREPGYLRRWGERFACYGVKPARQGVIWIHAVSVGESEAAFPLIRALSRRFPDRAMLVTTTTPTGSARVRAVLDKVEHVYLPYDLPDGVARFLDHFRPALAVIMETEIWPNLYHACRRRNIPLAIVNARLSERSAKGYRRLGDFTRSTLAGVSLIAAQTLADGERFLQAGAPKGSVKVMGNIKYDLELPEDYFHKATALRHSLFAGRKVWIAASTHEGEELQALEIFDRLRLSHPDLVLVLAPRHPPRFDPVANLCLDQGFKLRRRSQGGEENGAMDIFLLDTLGELRLFYAAADIAFVGGSLVPVGGHNVLEPAHAGVPVAFGPHLFNFEEAARLLESAGGAVKVADAAELAGRLDELLKDEGSRNRMGERAKAFVENGRGALSRVEEALCALMPQDAASDKP